MSASNIKIAAVADKLSAEAFFLAFCFCLSFVKLWYGPYFHDKVQPAELIFLGVLPLWVRKYGVAPLRALKSWWWVLLPYLAVNLASAALSGATNSLLEGIGRCYLVVVFALAFYWGKKHDIELPLRYWQYGALLMAVIALTGYAAALLGYSNSAIRLYQDYPYLGTIYRTAGFTGGPGMLVSVLLLPCLYTWGKWRRGEQPLWVLVLLLVAVLLTFSKELLLLVLGCLLLDPITHDWPRALKISTAALFAIVFWLGSHSIALPIQQYQANHLRNTSYSSYEPLARTGSVQWVASSYLALKKAAWEVGKQNLWLGVGPGNFNQSLPKLKANGKYPSHLPNYDPHSTWTGAFAETGALGLLSLSALVVFAFKKRSRLPGHHRLSKKETSATNNFALSLLRIYLLLLLINSINIDAMNFRHLWLPLGLLAGYRS